jgi:hypothetical protein
MQLSIISRHLSERHKEPLVLIARVARPDLEVRALDELAINDIEAKV